MTRYCLHAETVVIECSIMSLMTSYFGPVVVLPDCLYLPFNNYNNTRVQYNLTNNTKYNLTNTKIGI